MSGFILRNRKTPDLGSLFPPDYGRIDFKVSKYLEQFNVFKAIFVLFRALPESTAVPNTDFLSHSASLTHAAVEERRWSLTLPLKGPFILSSLLLSFFPSAFFSFGC